VTKQKQPGDGRLTIDIPEAARRLGIGKNQGYSAAARGEIPTLKLGKRVVVPVAALEQLLAGTKKTA
jgi:excisionase family DNA binding protein